MKWKRADIIRDSLLSMAISADQVGWSSLFTYPPDILFVQLKDKLQKLMDLTLMDDDLHEFARSFVAEGALICGSYLTAEKLEELYNQASS